MASNQLPNAARTKLNETIDRLFGRVLTGFVCPLTYTERLTLARCSLSYDDVLRIEGLENVGVLRQTVYAVVRVDNQRLRLWGKDAPNGTAQGTLCGVAHPTVTSSHHISIRLGSQTAAAFLRWLDEAVKLTHDLDTALETVSDILKMVKTAGHLRRMVPELYRLTPGLKLDPLSRASTVPYEWSSYPRRPVEWLCETIAKCQLLPDSEAKWSDREEYTWPVVGKAE